jgi:uncharacterized protein YcbK (DUF882 family)
MALKHFKLSEFESPDLPGVNNMCLKFLKKLDKARAIAGIPFFITSGYRSPQHNLDVGGVQDSAHTLIPCKAVDIACNNSINRQKIIRALAEVGLTRRLGISKSFIHTDDSQKTDAIWLY